MTVKDKALMIQYWSPLDLKAKEKKWGFNQDSKMSAEGAESYGEDEPCRCIYCGSWVWTQHVWHLDIHSSAACITNTGTSLYLSFLFGTWTAYCVAECCVVVFFLQLTEKFSLFELKTKKDRNDSHFVQHVRCPWANFKRPCRNTATFSKYTNLYIE